MKTSNAELMKRARVSLDGKWGLAVGTFLMYGLLVGIANSIPEVGWVLSLIISGPFTLGISLFSLSISRNTNPKLEQIFSGFKDFSRTLVTYLLMCLYILLWSLLLIVPGIVAAIGYSMTFYLMVDNKNLKGKEALDQSKKIMMGNKWKLFWLWWRFFGWVLLSILTLGIGFLWLIPYVNITLAKFYEDIKGGKKVLLHEYR